MTKTRETSTYSMSKSLSSSTHENTSVFGRIKSSSYSRSFHLCEMFGDLRHKTRLDRRS